MRGEIKDGKTIAACSSSRPCWTRASCEYLYEDTALVVLDKPAGLSSEDGVPPPCGSTGTGPDAYVGSCTGWTPACRSDGLCRTPRSRRGLSRQVTQSQQPMPIRMAGPSRPVQPAALLCQTVPRRASQAGRTKPARRGILRDYCSRTAGKAGCFRSAARARACGSRAGIPHSATPGRSILPCGDHPPHRPYPSDPGAVCLPKHPLWGDGKYGSRMKGAIALQSCGLRFVHPDTGKVMDFRLPGRRTWNLWEISAGENDGTHTKLMLKSTPCWSGRSST